MERSTVKRIDKPIYPQTEQPCLDLEQLKKLSEIAVLEF